jgi:hypothetical protein
MKFKKLSILLVTTALTACQSGKTVNEIKNAASRLTSNSAFAAISDQISALEAVVAVAQSNTSISALVDPDDNDMKMAGDVVTQIDNVIFGWNNYKASMDPHLLAVKLSTDEWRQAEAVVKILKEDLRPVVTKVVNGGSYDTQDFEFLAKKETLDKKIFEKKAAIFEGSTPTVISASTSSVTLETSATKNSEERVKSIDITNGEQTVTGGDSLSNLTRTATWTKTTSKNMEYDRTFTLMVQNVTTTVFSDGSTKEDRGEIREVVNKQTFDAAPQVSTEELYSTFNYISDVKNEPTVIVTRGETATETEYEDRTIQEVQTDKSILHRTLRKTTITKTTPVTTTTTYPNITIYSYSDGHTYTHDDTDQVETETVNEVNVEVADNELIETTTEHVVASETVTNEVITKVAESDPVFVTTHEDKTTIAVVEGNNYNTVTRHYKTVATVTTTTTTKTTPVTKKIWTDGKEELIRGETVVDVKTADTLVNDEWVKVMSSVMTGASEEFAEEIDNDVSGVNMAHLGTRTTAAIGVDHRTAEFLDGQSTGHTVFKDIIKADLAYSRGWTGKGSLVTIADTGYNTSHSDLEAKHTYNTLTGDTSDMNDNVGHGSHVMGIAAGRKNGTGIHGVAYDADVAVVKITDNKGYSFSRARQGASWAAGIGSIAYNVSANYNSDSALRSSIVNLGDGNFKSNHSFYGQYGYNGVIDEAPLWAAALGTEQILVNSAGNQTSDVVFGTGQMATATDSNGDLILGGRMLVAGNWDQSNNVIQGAKGGHLCTTYDEAANVCKDAASIKDFYILAPGMSVRSAYKGDANAIIDMSGTSMAAPQVTGALAILNQMWPHMKGKNLVKLVTTTADKTIAGYNVNTHGQGLLDLNSATQPVGTTGIPTSGRTNGSISRLSGGGAIGNISNDAFAALSNTIVLDEFERDFEVDLSQTQAVDTRPGSYVETLAFGAENYDAYGNLAVSDQNIDIPEIMGFSAGMKINSGVDGDYAIDANYKAYQDENTRLDFGLGFLKETGKFLNNVQEGFMGVGEHHTTQYASLTLKHDFSNSVFGFGNYQIGTTDVQASKEFSLVTGYSNLVSQSFNTGLALKPSEGWTLGGTYSQPLHVMSGSMNYRVPTGRTVDGKVMFNEGSADASTKIFEHDFGLFVKYRVQDNFTMAGFGEKRLNVAGTKGNDQLNAGIKLRWLF